MTSDDGGLVALARAIDQAIGRPTPQQRQLLDRLERLTARLQADVYQLAVLGQFKRGKSTLLNALLGCPLLSAGILPLTAVPTFLSYAASMRLKLSFLSGNTEEREAGDLASLSREIAAATTEEQNPRNEKGVSRVDVGVPASAWLADLTLVDTPGIGSTHAHNSDAAYAILPECDAALFVSSVDPPITEVEAGYLARIRKIVPQVIVVLNKVDLVDGNDVRKAADFLSSVIGEHAPEIDGRIFTVSARRALAARQAGDDEALEASGLPELERHVRSKLVDKKRSMLDLSVASKMSELLAALAADAAMTVRALSMPLADLDAKVIAFEESAVGFERERVALADALQGEWGRAVTRLASLCDEVDQSTRQDLDAVVARVAETQRLEAGNEVVTAAMAEVFDREFKSLAARVEEELRIAIEAQQERYLLLDQRVREAAGALLNVNVPTLASEDWFQIAREPYWVGERRHESVSSLTVDGLARLLPGPWKRRRRARLYRAAIGNALARNISELQWTMRQNIDDSFRRLLAESRKAIETSIASTRDLLATSRERRRKEDLSLEQDLGRVCHTERRLKDLARTLAERAPGHPRTPG